MAYATMQDAVDRFGEDEMIQLSDTENLGELNEAKINQALNDASAEIDGYLSRYPLPLLSAPKVLVRLCCDLARYYLHDDLVDKDSVVVRRYEAGIQLLESVSKGVVSLGLDQLGARPKPNDGAVMASGGRVFGRDDKGFI